MYEPNLSLSFRPRAAGSFILTLYWDDDDDDDKQARWRSCCQHPDSSVLHTRSDPPVSFLTAGEYAIRGGFVRLVAPLSANARGCGVELRA